MEYISGKHINYGSTKEHRYYYDVNIKKNSLVIYFRESKSIQKSKMDTQQLATSGMPWT